MIVISACERYKPCPFCGGKKQYVMLNVHDNITLDETGEKMHEVIIRCHKCGATANGTQFSEEDSWREAIEKWNMRV